MKKLSVRQQHVVDLMKDGWDLGSGSGFVPDAWLQKDGLGKGGMTETVHAVTLLALRDKDVIEPTGPSFPTQRYILKGTPSLGRKNEEDK